MNISVVIPTCNRKSNLLALLNNLNESTTLLQEVIIIDSGEENLSAVDCSVFRKLQIGYFHSEKSVCVQRNIGINKSSSDWIFICDDDIEVPVDYLEKLSLHISKHPEAGAVSGLVLQKENDECHFLAVNVKVLIQIVFVVYSVAPEAIYLYFRQD